MSGHSHWSKIKRQKEISDPKRGQLFTKLAREITVAARQGGTDRETNVRLRLAVAKARENNLPQENVERAIQRAVGGKEGELLEELTYEGYSPGGAAIFLHAMTGNRNRTASEVRHLFSRFGGNLGEAGSVIWAFEAQGVLTIEAPPAEAENIALLAIDAGAQDFKVEDSYLEVYSQPEKLGALHKALEKQGVTIASAELSMVPKTTVPLDEKTAEQTLRLLEQLEELDDVQKVYTNADFPNTAVERYRGAA